MVLISSCTTQSTNNAVQRVVETCSEIVDNAWVFNANGTRTMVGDTSYGISAGGKVYIALDGK